MTKCLHICGVLIFFWAYRLRYNSNSTMSCLVCLQSPFWCIYFLTLFTFDFSYEIKCSLCFLRVKGEPTILIFYKSAIQKYISCDLLYGSQNSYKFWRYDYKFYTNLQKYIFFKSHNSPFWCIFLLTFDFLNQSMCSLCFLRVTCEPTIHPFLKILFKNIFHVDLLNGSQNLYSFRRYDYKSNIKLQLYLFSYITIPTVFTLCFIWCVFSPHYDAYFSHIIHI